MELKLKTQSAGVRTFAISDDSKLVCVADDSSAVLIYSLTTSQSPSGKTFSSCNLESKVKGITSTSVVRDFFSLGFKLSWLPHKSILAVAVPSSNGVTTIFYRKGGKSLHGSEGTAVWEEIFLTTSSASNLTHGNKDMNIASFSPNGRFLATADQSGDILLWEISDLDSTKDSIKSDSFTPFKKFSSYPTGSLFDIVWGQKDGDNYIMLLSGTGSAVVQNVIDTRNGRCLPTGTVVEVPKVITPKKVPLPYRSAENNAAKAAAIALEKEKEMEKEKEIEKEKEKVKEKEKEIEKMKEKEEERKREKESSLDAILGTTSSSSKPEKPSRLSKKMSAVIDNDEDDDLSYEGAPDNNIDDLDKENENENEISENEKLKRAIESADLAVANLLRPKDNKNGNSNGNGNKNNSTSNSGGMSDANMSSMLALIAKNKADVPTVQSPFQPSSTTYDEKRRRFLVWNSIGNITCSDLSMNNRIEIRFTDSNRNKPEAFNDSFGFTMASLSYEGAIFASDPEEDYEGSDPLNKLKGSTVFYHAFPGQAHMKGANEVRLTFLINHVCKIYYVCMYNREPNYYESHSCEV